MTAPDSPQRLFLAVWPSEPVVRHLATALAPVRADAPDWLRWQPERRWHLTLLFLGSCTADQAAHAAAAAADTAAQTVPQPVRLAGARRSNSILWVGVAGGAWLDPANRRLSRALLPHDRRERFTAHLTVARARRHRVPREPVEALREYEGPMWTPSDLALVRSVTGPQPEYETIARFPFAE